MLQVRTAVQKDLDRSIEGYLRWSGLGHRA